MVADWFDKPSDWSRLEQERFVLNRDVFSAYQTFKEGTVVRLLGVKYTGASVAKYQDIYRVGTTSVEARDVIYDTDMSNLDRVGLHAPDY